MILIEQLRAGDKVRIVDEWPEPHRESPGGHMDKYLSAVMTVRKFYGGSARMEEDINDCGRADGWSWFPEMIAEIVSTEPEPDFEIDGAVFDALFS